MDSHEDSPSRLRSVLQRTKRGKDDNLPSPNPDLPDRATRAGDASEMRKSHTVGTDLEMETSEPKIVKLLPGHNKRKEKRRKAQQDAEDATRGRDPSLAKVATSASLGTGDSLSTLGSQNDVEASSLMTSESEDERDGLLSRSTASAPLLASRDSHSGYLTSSSPNIRAVTLVDPPVPSPVGLNRGPTPPRASTVPTPVTKSKISGLNGDSTLSLGSTGSGKSDNSRSVSPGERLKEVLRSNSKKASDVADSSHNVPQLPQDNAGSFTARRASRGVEPVSPIPTAQTWHASGHQSNKSLPSIITTPGTPPPLPTKTFDKLSTVVTPPSPVDDFAISSPTYPEDNSTPPASGTLSFPAAVAAPAATHRRARSDSQTNVPSKLSQSMNAPLTPTVEEVKTPGTRNISISSTGGGFFTSMFSAAQTAANTLTTTLGNNNNRSRSSTTTTLPTGETQSREVSPGDGEEKRESVVVVVPEEVPEPVKPLAIDTIGSGDLSLSHLGISNEDPAAAVGSGSPYPDSAASRSRSGTVVHREEAAAKEEETSAARAVSAAYEEKPTDAITPLVEDTAAAKISGTAVGGSAGERTPNGSVVDGEPGELIRSSSLKSKLDRKRRRTRDGSQSTLGPAITASGSSLISPSGSMPKVTGYAVASKKRNKDFHTLFKSVPDNDYLIEDYSCALQRDIILAGRIYISEGHICFSSNILGWVTTLVISFDEVVSVEKESTAMVFPNAIAVQTLHARHTFRSLLGREATYDLLIGIWKISHPGIQSSENGTRVANRTGSMIEKFPNGEGSEASDDDELDDEDDLSGSDDDDQGSAVLSGEGSVIADDSAGSPQKSAIPRKASNIGLAAGQAAASGPTVSEGKAAAQANGAAATSTDFPGPVSHVPSQCADSATHYPTLLKDDIIAAPLGKIYNMVFGPASGGFMSRWLVDDQKSLELSFDDDKKGLGEEIKSRSYNYIKLLGGSIGPKQTKCITTENLDAFDLEKAVSVTVTTQTPDVPSGNVFSVKTRYCLMWAPNNSTRMIATCTIEWTGKSWLKSPIEKGANDGQVAYVNDLLKALRAASSKGKSTTSNGAGSTSKSKRSKKRKGASDAEASTSSLATPAKPQDSDWGLFEPVHSILSPVIGILGPVLNVYGLVLLLSLTVVMQWFRGPSTSSSAARTLYRAPTSQRIAAYEELWRAEEAALWTWLEERIGTEALPVPAGHGGKDAGKADRRKTAQSERQRVLKGEGGIGGMAEREVERAVEITEEKLRLLKDTVKRVKGDGVVEQGKYEL